MKSIISTYRGNSGFRAVVGALALALVATGCGSRDASQQGADPSVSGVVSTDGAAPTQVTLRDAAGQARTADVDASGAFKFDVSGLTPPYLLEATDGSGDTQYALATKAGSTNVNGLSTAIVRASSDDGEDAPSSYRTADIEDLMARVRTVLAPLFQHYGVTFGDDMEDSSAYRKMLSEVSFSTSNGMFTVTNRATGAVIYSAPLRNITSGVLHPENIPSDTTPTPTPTPVTCTSFTYNPWGACSSSGTQTRTVATSSPSGCTGGTPVLSQSCTAAPVTCTGFTYSSWGACSSSGTQTRTVIASTPTGCTGGSPTLSQSCTYVPPVTTCSSFTYSAWGACQTNNTQTRTVTASSPSGCTGGTPVLSQACTYVPPACTYTYSSWGACQSNGTQTRTVTSSSPSGCSGTPVVSQSCTYVPPPPTNPVTSANIVSSCTTCHGLTSNTTVFKSGGYSVSGRSASQWLSTVNTMVGFGASLAPGTTAQNYADYLAGVP